MKVMVVVMIIGYFVIVVGFYFVDNKNNDVNIFIYMLKLNLEDIKYWV